MYYSTLHYSILQILFYIYFWHELCFIVCLSKGNLLLESTHITNMPWEPPFNVKSLGQHLHLIPSPLRQAWINLRCTGIKILFSSLFWYYQRIPSRHIHLLTLHCLGTKSGDLQWFVEEQDRCQQPEWRMSCCGSFLPNKGQVDSIQQQWEKVLRQTSCDTNVGNRACQMRTLLKGKNIQ